MSGYRTLDPDRIIGTAVLLEQRIAERFPDRGLRTVAAELVSLSRDLSQAAADLKRPVWWLLAIDAVALIAGLAAILFFASRLPFDRLSTSGDLFQSAQGFEAMLNTLILAVVGIIALVGLQDRYKRKRVFQHLHGLRSLIHVIDMHQLTKDPAALSDDFQPTAHSPKRITDRQELARYLDYCSEMISITGKLAALFAQAVNDAVVVEAVNDIEALGSNLSRKVWQKITLIESGAGHKAH